MKTVIEDESKWEQDEGDEEIIADLKPLTDERITVYSRDWTIETIYAQIEKDNIDLNPKFQRRNAWKDDKKSKLLESFILSLPVPEIIFAENPKKPKSFIIIDGKQRLLTIAGFINPEKYPYWRDPKLSGLKSRSNLNGLTYDDLIKNPNFTDEVRTLMNSDMRCTIVSGFKSSDVLYDIFYRLNTGSVLLSAQELRQVLNKGPFANYLYEKTETIQPIHSIMSLSEPDPRLFDMEFILRFIAFSLRGKKYTGNLKKFLDDTMGEINKKWGELKPKIDEIYKMMNYGIDNLHRVFNSSQIGRRYVDKGYFPKYNKVISEVQIYYFARLREKDFSASRNKQFKQLFQDISINNQKFNDTISKSTKDLSKYRERYDIFREIVNKAYGTSIEDTPVSVKK